MNLSWLKVSVILPGRRSDHGYNTAMFEGARRASSRLGFRLKIRESVDAAHVGTALRQDSEQGHGLIFAHSIDYQRSLEKMAPLSPKTQYVIHPSFGFNPQGLTNVVAMDDRLEEGAYLAGVLAAGLTKTGTIAFIGGKQYSSQIAIAKAYRLGATKYRRDLKVVLHFTEVWTDKQAGRRGVERVSSNGADVVLFRGDGITLGGIEECSRRKIYAIGDLWDQNSLAPSWVVSSNVWRMQVPVEHIVRMHAAGELMGWKAFAWGVRERACGLAPYHGLASKIPRATKGAVALERKRIASGEFKVPFDAERRAGDFVTV